MIGHRPNGTVGRARANWIDGHMIVMWTVTLSWSGFSDWQAKYIIFYVFPLQNLQETVNMNPKTISVIGSLFLTRLHDHICHTKHDKCNLNLDCDSVYVKWHAHGRLMVQNLHNFWGGLPLLTSLSPLQIAVIHIGANDLCYVTPLALMS